MKFANAIEGGIAGVTTLTLLEKALQNADTGKPKMKLLGKPGVVKRLKKKLKKNRNDELFIELAKELLAAGAYYGFVKLGKKKNVLLRGALLGAATGVGVAFLNDKEHKKADEPAKRIRNADEIGMAGNNKLVDFWNTHQDKLLTIGLYTAGGILAGAAIRKVNRKLKKK